VILRPSILFGREDNFINRFATMIRFLPVLPVIAPETKFQPVYVGDVADAVLRALATPAAAGKTFELGGPKDYSFKDLLVYIRELSGRRCLTLLPVPFPVAMVQAAFMELLPGKPLTGDQVVLLRYDNVVSGTLPGLSDLGVLPTAVELVVPSYLGKPRSHGG